MFCRGPASAPAGQIQSTDLRKFKFTCYQILGLKKTSRTRTWMR